MKQDKFKQGDVLLVNYVPVNIYNLDFYGPGGISYKGI